MAWQQPESRSSRLAGLSERVAREPAQSWKAWEVLERYSRDREGAAQQSSRTEKPVAIAALDSR
jgi:hypothetical protein